MMIIRFRHARGQWWVQLDTGYDLLTERLERRDFRPRMYEVPA